MYLKSNGRLYGIKPRRSLLVSCVANIPFICRLYTIKIEVNVVSRQKGGAPVHGLVEKFRIFKRQKDILFNFVPLDTIENPYKYADKITSKNGNVRIAQSSSPGVVHPSGIEVQSSLVREDI